MGLQALLYHKTCLIFFFRHPNNRLLLNLVQQSSIRNNKYCGTIWPHLTVVEGSSVVVRVLSQLTVAHHNQATLSCFSSLSASGYLSFSPFICPCLPQSVYGFVFADLYHSFNQSVFALKPSLLILFHITPFVFTSSIRLPCPHIHLVNLSSCPPSVHLWKFGLFFLYFSTVPLFSNFTWLGAVR